MTHMEALKISLVIPAYNEEKYIGACLEHAIASSQNRFHEIIVVDNNSSDRTAAIAGAIPGVRVVRESQKGITHARQCGYLASTGDVIAYTDADTHMPEGWYDKVALQFAKTPGLACLSGPYIYYDISKFQQFLVAAYWYVLAMPVYWIVGYMTVGGNFAIRRSVLDKMHGFDTTIAFYGEDTNIARRAHEFGTVRFSPRLVMYTSGRRLAGEGIVRTSLQYIGNFLSEAIMHKPVTKGYKDFR